MKKRIVAILCSLSLILSFSSCAGKNENSPAITTAETTVATATTTEATTTTVETTTEATTTTAETTTETTTATAETTTEATTIKVTTTAETTKATTTAKTTATELTTTTASSTTTKTTTATEAVTATIDASEEKIPEGYIESMNKNIKFTQVSNNVYKTEDCSNPLSPAIFCADPTAVEYEGRLYVYGTNDHQQYETVGDDGKNTYESIRSFVIFSTDDMVNWTYHGKIDTKAIAPWIISSWAPSITSRVEEDGLTHFYLYFSNNGCGVGVITATSPIGPWSDPLGRPLVSASTNGLENCPNPFDPGVCIDENGVGWLSFGGGRASYGTDYMPGVSRIVQLGEDMVSFASDFVEIKAPYFFEASELNYINGTYIYTYNNSWDARNEWNFNNIEKPSQCSMSYMTTKTPLDTDSWEYKGDYFPNPGECGLDYSNNHSHLHKYNGKYYMFHHTMLKQARMETNGGFRSLSVVELPVDEKNIIFTETKTSAKSNVTQIKYVDPYSENKAENFFTSAGIGYEYEDTLVKAVKAEEKGAWIYVKGVDFDDKKAEIFSAIVKGSGRIQIHADEIDSEPIAVLEFDNDDYRGVYNKITDGLEGVHNLYILVSDTDIYIDIWSFM